jgi:hypothetical protein
VYLRAGDRPDWTKNAAVDVDDGAFDFDEQARHRGLWR